MRLYALISVALLNLVLLVAGCGGGGGANVRDDGGAMPPPPARNLTTLPRRPETFGNPVAHDPLPSFRSARLPAESSFTYRRTVPNGLALDMDVYTNPDADVPPDTVAMMRRAAKVWTRRIAGVREPGGDHQSYPHDEPGADGWVRMDLLVGYAVQSRCQRACANHHGDDLLLPENRTHGGEQPVISLTEGFLANYLHDDRAYVTIGGFRVLAHEFGHILDHQDPSNEDHPEHGNCDSGAIMCDRWETDVPAVPAERDFEHIRHHYDVMPATDHETFGIWATADGTDIERFGLRVVRTLAVERAENRRDEAASDFMRDSVHVEAGVFGTLGPGPVTATGTATWTGDVIAVDTSVFRPVLGDAALMMDLSDTSRLDASFTELHRTEDSGATMSLPSRTYTLMRDGNVWAAPRDSVTAGFYAVGEDAAGAVAGTIDDGALIGAFGAVRE